jgi:ribosomal protein L16 Arg81 hydroxylase
VEKRLSSDFEVPVSLDWLIHPTTKAAFFKEYWEQKTLVVRRDQQNYFSYLLSLDDVDRAITTLNLTYPNITLKNASKEVRPSDYTTGNGTLDVAAVYQLFSEGSTIVLAFLDNVLPPLTSLCRGLERELSFPLQANAYLTPARAQGAKYHYDTHDVFVLQITGSKHWTVYGTPLQLPLNNQDFDSKIHERGAPVMEFELEPGDVAYVPRGVVHEARSSENLSLHITVGILCYRWADLLLEFVADASLKDPAFRRGLPPGFANEDSDKSQAQEIFRSLLKRLATNTDCAPILDRFADRWISACPPLLNGQMEQLALLERLRIESVVGARSSAVFRLVKDGSSTSVYAFARKISFPAQAEDALRFALNRSSFSIHDLPGNLDDGGKLVLIRRLVREGLMVVRAV